MAGLGLEPREIERANRAAKVGFLGRVSGNPFFSGNSVNRGNGAAPLVQRLYETSHSFTILLYKTSYYTKVEAMNSAPNVGTHRADGASGATGYLEVERSPNVAGLVFGKREQRRSRECLIGG